MKYYIDTEFDGEFIISIAFVPEEYPLKSLYLARSQEMYMRDQAISGWVSTHVLPFVEVEGAKPEYLPYSEWGHRIEEYFKGFPDDSPHIVSDWPKDIEYFCRIICNGPNMIDLAGFTTEVVRVDPWDESCGLRMEGAVRHNALWDARMLWLHQQELGGE